ncbi:hypothetical protein D3C76_1377010 [compost metagenome]
MCNKLFAGAQRRRINVSALTGGHAEPLALHVVVVAGDLDDFAFFQDDGCTFVGIDGDLAGLETLDAVLAVFGGDHHAVAGAAAQRKHNGHGAVGRHGRHAVLLKNFRLLQCFPLDAAELSQLDTAGGGDARQACTKGQPNA